ncbi:MAG: glycosyltransferase family 4 protein, partial [Saprospiraceae bacterium]
RKYHYRTGQINLTLFEVDMKILFVSNSSWNLYNFRRPLISALIMDGHEVSCLCKESKTKLSLINELGCKIVAELEHVNPRIKNPMADFFLMRELFKKYKDIKPDVIFLYTPKLNIYGGIVARILGIQYINNITGLGSEFTRKMRLPFYIKLLYRWSLRKAIRVISHNAHDLDYLISNGICKKENSEVIPGSGIDLEYFTSERKIKSVVNFLFSGRFLEEKGVIEYLEAAIFLSSRYSHHIWNLVGDNYGVGSRRIDKLIEKAKLISNIRMYEFTDNIKQYYEAFDCFVLPSYREGLSKSLLEAMSMERIVIASDVPGCREAIKQGVNGFLMASQNTIELTNIMEKVIHLKESEIEKLCMEARAQVKNVFSKQIIVGLYKSIIQGLAK